MTFWETVQRGEYVMIALAVIVIIICWLWIWRSRILSAPKKSVWLHLLSVIKDNVEEGDLDSAIEICLANKHPQAKILAAGLTFVGHPIPEIYQAMKREADMMNNGYEIGIPWLKFFAVMSPLLGACGTLAGICTALRDIGQDEFMADINLLAEAIAPTIPTVISGIGVGILALAAIASIETKITMANKGLKSVEQDLALIINNPG